MKCWYPTCDDPVFTDRVCAHHWFAWFRSVWGEITVLAVEEKHAPSAATLSA